MTTDPRYPWALRVEHWTLAERALTRRDDWGPGPWEDEPDLLEWRSPAGLPLLIVRSGVMGVLCGYVGVPPGHPLHGVAYRSAVELALEPHGGITYSGACSGAICHVPQPGEPENVWWFGFDCGHFRDVTPALVALQRIRGDRYWTVEHVRHEVLDLCEQLVAADHPAVREMLSQASRGARDALDAPEETPSGPEGAAATKESRDTAAASSGAGPAGPGGEEKP